MAAMELARAALERTEVWQFGVVILFFHVSEYALAVAFHGLSNVTRSSECLLSFLPWVFFLFKNSMMICTCLRLNMVFLV